MSWEDETDWESLTESLRETEKQIARELRDNPKRAEKEYMTTAEGWEQIRQWPGEF